MSDAEIKTETPVTEPANENPFKAMLLRKDVIVIVVLGAIFVGLHFSMSGKTNQSAAQPGTQAWCVMNGQKDYRELMREFGVTLPQSKGLIAKCAKLFETTGGENAKIFKAQQDGMKNQTRPVTTGAY